MAGSSGRREAREEAKKRRKPFFSFDYDERTAGENKNAFRLSAMGPLDRDLGRFVWALFAGGDDWRATARKIIDKKAASEDIPDGY